MVPPEDWNAGQQRLSYLAEQPWPEWDEEALKTDEVEIAVQVDGKVRGHLMVGMEEAEDSVKARALVDPKVQSFIDGKQVLDNGGAHAMEEVAGTMNLTAGEHALKVEFFEKDIDAGCKMSWKGPMLEKQIVPAAVLFH